jgi:hypothetical protein
MGEGLLVTVMRNLSFMLRILEGQWLPSWSAQLPSGDMHHKAGTMMSIIEHRHQE